MIVIIECENVFERENTKSGRGFEVGSELARNFCESSFSNRPFELFRAWDERSVVEREVRV